MPLLFASTKPGSVVGIANVIGSGSTTDGSPARSIFGVLLAQMIASRREPAPVSLVFVTTRLQAACTVKAAENSEVSTGSEFGFSSVAVAVTNLPVMETGDVKAKAPVSPLASEMLVSREPRKVWPSPLPEGSATFEAKNSTRNLELGRLLSVAEMTL